MHHLIITAALITAAATVYLIDTVRDVRRRQRAAGDAEYRAWQARRDALFDKAPHRA